MQHKKRPVSSGAPECSVKAPRLVFKNFPERREVEMLYGFLFHSNWAKYVLLRHPDLETCLRLKTEKERKAFLRRYVIAFQRKNKASISNQTRLYKKEWAKVYPQAFEALSDIIGTKWPNRTITAYVSINPICPRFLNERSFSIFYHYPPKRAKEIILHESCHFLYFKKWRELFPKSNPKTFEMPHLVWNLSEIVAPVLLNDSKVNKYIGQRAQFYTEHTKMKIDHATVPAYFTKLYKNVAQKKGFGVFLKEAYKTAKENENVLKF